MDLQNINLVSGDSSIAYIIVSTDKIGDFCFGYFETQADAWGFIQKNYPSLTKVAKVVAVTRIEA